MIDNERQAIFDTARDAILAALPEAWALFQQAFIGMWMLLIYAE
jgi:hypothetical protein